MGGQPCYLKILMNGQRTAQVINDITGEVQLIRRGLTDYQIPEDVGYKMVELFNRMEDDALAANRLLLEASGFPGPWPKSLS